LRHSFRIVCTALVSTLIATAPSAAIASCARARAAAPFNKAQSASQQPDDSKRAEIARYTSALQSADEEERRNAILMLGEMHDPATAAPLQSALADNSESVRAAAIAALGELRQPTLAPLIAIYLTKDKHTFVRKTAAYALGQLGGSDAVAALIAGLRDKDAEVRGAAAVGLENTPDAAAIAPLIQALRDKSEFVRAHAAAALGANGRASAQAVPNLVKMLTTDNDHDARRQAATALGRIGEPSALPALERAARSADPYLSQAARDALSQFHSQ
jgi:HEAT repeat protein